MIELRLVGVFTRSSFVYSRSPLQQESLCGWMNVQCNDTRAADSNVLRKVLFVPPSEVMCSLACRLRRPAPQFEDKAANK